MFLLITRKGYYNTNFLSCIVPILQRKYILLYYLEFSRFFDKDNINCVIIKRNLYNIEIE